MTDRSFIEQQWHNNQDLNNKQREAVDEDNEIGNLDPPNVNASTPATAQLLVEPFVCIDYSSLPGLIMMQKLISFFGMDPYPNFFRVWNFTHFTFWQKPWQFNGPTSAPSYLLCISLQCEFIVKHDKDAKDLK